VARSIAGVSPVKPLTARGPAALWWRRRINALKLLWHLPHRSLSWLFIAVFGYLIVVPVVEIVVGSFQVRERDIRRIGAAVGEWTLFYWERAFASPFSQSIFYEPLKNTVVVASGFTLLSMAIGVSLAWLLVKTDMPFKKLISTATIVPFILPSWSLALAWIAVFRNDQIGVGAPGLIQGVFGYAPPDWMTYGPVPIILVLAINYAAFTYLITAASLTTVDAALEEAAEIKGATGFTRFRLITLPLILPGIGSAFILTLAAGLSTFGVPAFLGSPTNYQTLSTSLYAAAGAGRFGDAYVYIIVLISISLVAIYANARLLGSRRQYTTMTGKGAIRKTVPLGRWRWPITAIVLTVLFLGAVVPIVMLVWQSLQFRLGDYSLSNLSLAYWTGRRGDLSGILVDPRILNAAWNSIRLSVSVGVLTAFVGVLVGYAITKGRGSRLARLLEQVSFLPYLIPGIAFGAIYLTMWAQPRGILPALYGTFALLVLAAFVNRLPFATRTGIAAMMQVGPALEEAAQVKGAGVVRRMRSILFPLVKGGLLAGFILSFVSTIKDLSLVVLLITPRTVVLPVVTMGFAELGYRQLADAISVLIIVIVLGGTWLAQWLTKTDPLTGFGGR
jgi:iron(III) transport system permease protein